MPREMRAERMRDASAIAWLETVVRDVRYGFRQLLKSSVLLIVALLSLALGIGANTAIFTMIKAVMLELLPVRDPASLVLFYDGISTGVYDGGDVQSSEFSYPFFEYLHAHNDSFEDLCAFRQSNDRVIMHVPGTLGSALPEYAVVHLVSGNYFHLLGVEAAAGRLFADRDDSPASPPTAVISYDFWRSRFHLDPAIPGKTVVLNGTAFTIIGVADSTFFGERVQTAPSFWLPLSFEAQILKEAPWLKAQNVYWLNFLGRLKPGVTMQQAQAASNVRLHGFYLAQTGAHPSESTRNKILQTRIQLKPGGAGISALRYVYSKPLYVLMAVVALVLLIACANVATLLLARASARSQEFLCRLALGAPRARLLRQVLTESILLSILGGLVGTLFAWWAIKLLVLMLHVTSVVKVRPDPAVLAFTLLLSVLTGILFGVIPAVKFSRLDPRPGNSDARGWRAKRFGSTQALIVFQVALSMVLLLAASLLAHSLVALERQNPGFVRERILLASPRTDTRLAGYQQSELLPLYRELVERVKDLPGVASAAIANSTPESGFSHSSNLSIEAYTSPAKKELTVYWMPVGPRFFTTLEIPLILGRTINERDTPASTPVAVVNQTFVNLYLPSQNPIGKHMMLGSPFKAPGFEIIGVVSDSKYYDLRENPEPMAFFPLSQMPVTNFSLIVRTAADPSAVAGEIRRALKQVDSRLPFEITTLNQQVEHSLQQQKMITTLSSIFGVIALLLASIGIYGMLAYSVSGRTAEIGIRMAVGAQRSNIIWFVLRDLIALMFAGLALGFPFAIVGTRWIRSFLFGVPTLDSIALAVSILLIMMLALLAGYLPARRAARIDPMRALRHE